MVAVHTVFFLSNNPSPPDSLYTWSDNDDKNSAEGMDE